MLDGRKMHKNRGFYSPRNNRLKEDAVEDLRERLNKIKLEKEKCVSDSGVKNPPPPPDPTYNFLKDPLRDDTNACSFKDQKIFHKEHHNHKNKELHNNQKINKEYNKRQNKPRHSTYSVEDGEKVTQQTDNKKPHDGVFKNFRDKRIFAQPKLRTVSNITVEILPESGERKCVVDNSKSVEVPRTFKKNHSIMSKSGRWLSRGPQNYTRGKYRKSNYDSVNHKKWNTKNFQNKPEKTNENSLKNKNEKTNEDNQKSVKENISNLLAKENENDNLDNKTEQI